MAKEEWEKLELYVTERMKEVYTDAKITIGSGNKLDDGDSKSPDWLLECKYTGETQNINILRKWLDKIQTQAYKVGKEWGLVRRAKDTITTITIDFDIFIELLLGEFNVSRRTETDNKSRREVSSNKESNRTDKQETWSRDDLQRYSSGGANAHGTTKLRPNNKTVRRRKLS